MGDFDFEAGVRVIFRGFRMAEVSSSGFVLES